MHLNPNGKWKRHGICKDCVLYSKEINEGVLVAAPAERAMSCLQESAGPARRGARCQTVSCATLSSGLCQAGSAKSLMVSRNKRVTQIGRPASFPTGTSPGVGGCSRVILGVDPGPTEGLLKEQGFNNKKTDKKAQPEDEVKGWVLYIAKLDNRISEFMGRQRKARGTSS